MSFSSALLAAYCFCLAVCGLRTLPKNIWDWGAFGALNFILSILLVGEGLKIVSGKAIW